MGRRLCTQIIILKQEIIFQKGSWISGFDYTVLFEIWIFFIKVLNETKQIVVCMMTAKMHLLYK